MGGFFSFSPNEIAERALRENNADVILLINLKSKTVCYRKSKTCDLDVGKLAEKLAGGGGHEAAAGSLLNDTISNITKLLQPIEL
jgi:nanoRNase/pAp phosphatase (c-di-AMP/oligoRNAs hydrolase)